MVFVVSIIAFSFDVNAVSFSDETGDVSSEIPSANQSSLDIVSTEINASGTGFEVKFILVGDSGELLLPPSGTYYQYYLLYGSNYYTLHLHPDGSIEGYSKCASYYDFCSDFQRNGNEISFEINKGLPAVGESLKFFSSYRTTVTNNADYLYSSMTSGEESYCGDGVVGEGEACDGSDLAGATCVSQGFVSGVLGCTSSCAFDTSGCSVAGSAQEKVDVYLVPISDEPPAVGEPYGMDIIFKKSSDS